MTDIFAEEMVKAIDHYRLFLRRNLSQPLRVAKLAELKLKEVNYDSSLNLYNTGQLIVGDIESQFDEGQQGYYSYVGIQRFGLQLKNYLKKFEIEEGVLVHMAQKASNAILKAVQLVNGKSVEYLTDNIKLELFELHKTIVHYGLEEQFAIYRENLDKLNSNAPQFFMQVLNNFNSCLQLEEEGSQRAA